MAADVRAGLTKPFKELSPRYFYDERGSELFEQITELPEYYPTRAERAILERHAAEICAAAGNPATLIELGSGSASKTRVLLDAMREAGCLEAYAPVDISEEITRDTAEAVASEYGITVHGLVCDFERDLERMPLAGPRVIAFLGGTIGNFEPAQRASFLARVANLLGPDDHFLLGTDLVKDREALEAAYNDSAGVTAEFNKNVLSVLNRELGADFDLDAFEHVAFWDDENLWIDIRLRSLADQVVEISVARHERRRSGAARRCGPRSRPSSPARGSTASTPRPASRWSSGGPTPTSSSRCRSPARASDEVRRLARLATNP